MYPWFFELSPSGFRQRKLLKILHKFTDGVICKRREQLLNSIDINEKNKSTFLDVLLQSTVDGTSLSNADIREEVDTFMFEGHDTTTSGISFTLYHLAKNPLIQEKLYKEIERVIGHKQTAPVTYSQLQDLKYLEMVIKESLRLHPPVPMLGRQLTEDTIIDETVITAGTNIVIPVYAMHQYPDVFPEPEKFDPERFTNEAQMDRSPYSFIAFSAGPRNCIGQRFAMLEIKTVIAKILINFKLLPPIQTDKLKLRADLILKPENGLFLRVISR